MKDTLQRGYRAKHTDEAKTEDTLKRGYRARATDRKCDDRQAEKEKLSQNSSWSNVLPSSSVAAAVWEGGTRQPSCRCRRATASFRTATCTAASTACAGDEGPVRADECFRPVVWNPDCVDGRLRPGPEEPCCAEGRPLLGLDGIVGMTSTTTGPAVQPTWVCFGCSLRQAEVTMAACCWLHPTNLGHDLVLGACTLCGGRSSGMYFTDDPFGD